VIDAACGSGGIQTYKAKKIKVSNYLE